MNRQFGPPTCQSKVTHQLALAVAPPALPGCKRCHTTNEPAVRPHDLPNQRSHHQLALAVKGVAPQINRQFGPMTCLIKGRTTSTPWL
ncbi:hypothetical protein J6590_029502 [Homalodisca vitripennis]|nr:hypothetical protein J6590_029502 [Homalodisca vitripennis]